MITRFILQQLKKRGYEIFKSGYTDKNSIIFRKIFSSYKIDLLLDIGANEGQFAGAMKKIGYAGKIISFEPILSVYQKLKSAAASSSNWEVMNIGLGDVDAEKEINVSQNTFSSSLLDMHSTHQKFAPESVFVSKEKINVKKIDTIFNEVTDKAKNIYMKIDVQGYEKFVLEGAQESLKSISFIQLEMSLMPLYMGELLLQDMVTYMDNLGFQLYNLLPGFDNYEQGQLLQADGIFISKKLLPDKV